ncbi:DUF2913 family protein [Ferrimonas senticii]|uniref:DUF2913 family protein n=1 Tax=Ferrimonas senticii TaxID=394566 RepID=UPI000412E671|nr:DUF2913 family protein [Ferrimonas senticii]
MANGFHLAILALAQTAMAELAQGKQAGKVPANPTSEAHFFSAWVTRAIKTQRFPTSCAKQLLAWQKSARTSGASAGLKWQFEQIIATYQPLLEQPVLISKALLEQLFSELQQQDWYVERDYPVTRKVSHHTDGQHSLVICCEQWGKAIDADGLLQKPLSLYVRGDVRQLVQLAWQHGLLLHKVTDYKSLVKYHGEYLIYPANAGTTVAEFN